MERASRDTMIYQNSQIDQIVHNDIKFDLIWFGLVIKHPVEYDTKYNIASPSHNQQIF